MPKTNRSDFIDDFERDEERFEPLSAPWSNRTPPTRYVRTGSVAMSECTAPANGTIKASAHEDQKRNNVRRLLLLNKFSDDVILAKCGCSKSYLQSVRDELNNTKPETD